jgi:phosphohistidine phosphatase
MKTLLLMRHAKSSHKDKHRSDHDRPLNKQGKADIVEIAQHVAAAELMPDQIITSSARRARKTAKRLAAALGCEVPIERRDELYMASLDNLLDAVRLVKNSVNTVLIVGHNPGLESFVELLVGHPERLPTGSIACLRFNHRDWSRIAPQHARLVLETIWRPTRETEGDASDST